VSFPTAAVIIAAHTISRLANIEKCVASVGAGTIAPQEIIVVVDDNVYLADVLTTRLPPEVTVLLSDGKGASAARNTGVVHASSDVVCCIDDDAWAEPGWLEALLTTMADSAIVSVGGKILPEYEEVEGYQLPAELLWLVGATYAGHWQAAGPISRPIGANMAFRRAPFLDVGGFSSDFGPIGATKNNSNEEYFLALGLRKRYGDNSIVYAPTAIVHHYVPRTRLTWRYLIKRCWVEGVSKAKIRRYGSASTMDHDKGYLLETLIPAVFAHVWHGLRGKDGELKSAVWDACTIATTATGFLFGRMSNN